MYHLEILLARLLIFLLTQFQIKGRENVPSQGPFLVVANHLSVADPVILGARLGRRVTFMAKEELFQNLIHRFFIRNFGAFPVYREGTNREALRQAAQVLQKGKALGMFPEGKRSQEGRLKTALYGSALIAYHNKATILPVGIYGSEAIKGGRWIWHRPRIFLNIGQPFYLPEAGHALNKDQLAHYTDAIMQHIAELLPEKYQGEYAGKKPNEIRN